MGRSINYKEGEPLFLVETNFWYLFEKSPEDAIELLTNENNNPDINENTNIKRLLKIKQVQRNK